MPGCCFSEPRWKERSGGWVIGLSGGRLQRRGDLLMAAYDWSIPSPPSPDAYIPQLRTGPFFEFPKALLSADI